jgi:predicted small lipoprotein YifL
LKTSIHTLTAICAVALLSACGSGGSGIAPNAPNNPVADSPAPSPAPAPAPVAVAQTFASPAVFVAAGQASRTINLVNCRERVSLAVLTPSDATIRIDANGDVTFTYAGGSHSQGAGGQVPAISHVIAAASSIDSEIVIGSTQGVATNYYEFDIVDAGFHSIRLSYQRNNPNPDIASFDAPNSTSPDLDCELANGTVITGNFGDINARIAAITSGITSVNTAVGQLSTTLNSPTLTWVNHSSNTNIRAQLNITTGAVSVANQAGNAFTTLNFSQLLDPANAANEPFYREKREAAASANSGIAYQQITYGDNTYPTTANNFRIQVNANSEFETSARN